MWSNTKLLVLVCVSVIISGLVLLWFGLNSTEPVVNTPIPPQTSPDKSATSSGVVGVEGERVLVTKVIDGDTFEIKGGLRVRMIGVDTPETKDPRRAVGCFGRQASAETKNLIEGKAVILQKDISETDKYSRLLRYVFLPAEGGQTLFVNDYLIREGFAQTLTYPPDVKYDERFREAETKAKEAKLGLWGSCYNLK